MTTPAGYPIVNDPLYGHSAWGPQRGRRGEGVRDMEQVYIHYYSFSLEQLQTGSTSFKSGRPIAEPCQ